MKILKSIILVAILFIAYSSFAQNTVSPDHYSIYFADKTNTPYSVDKPEEFLSSKAIERRQQFNIPIIEEDLPVNSKYIKAVQEIGFEIVNVSKWLNCVIVFTEDTTLLEKLSDLAFVREKPNNKNTRTNEDTNENNKKPRIRKCI